MPRIIYKSSPAERIADYESIAKYRQSQADRGKSLNPRAAYKEVDQMRARANALRPAAHKMRDTHAIAQKAAATRKARGHVGNEHIGAAVSHLTKQK